MTDQQGRTVYSDEEIAAVVHAANAALQDIQGDPAPSQPWRCEDEAIKKTAIEGVRHAREGMSPRELHEAWCDIKRAACWVYGPEKDPEAMTHPCLVPYDDLPAGQRDKDRLLLAIVNALTHEMY